MKKWYKACPYCWEEIKEIAKKCKHCGELLDKDLRIERENKSNKPVFYSRIDSNWYTPRRRCPKCWFEWELKFKSKGSKFLEFLLFLFFFFPWAIYYAWREEHGYCICPKCWNDKFNVNEPEIQEKKEYHNEEDYYEIYDTGNDSDW